MERTVRTQRTLSKQDEIDEEYISVNCEEQQNSSGSPSRKSPCSDEPSPSTASNNNNVNNGNPSQTLHRSRSQNKVKLLVRSHAVREETSPPPDPEQTSCSPELFVTTADSGLHQNANSQSQPSQSTGNANNNGPVTNRRHKLRREGSSQENWENPPLSRGNSREQYDGIDLHQFIIETLNKNHKDRALLLKIESELVSLAKDPKRTVHKFAQMSSYQRMLVHRVAAYFSMEHNVDTSGVSVIVNTTKSTKLPDSRFREFVRDDLLLPEEPRRSILKRDSSSFDETGSFKSGDRMLSGDSRRSKSFEEREEEYEKARRRIFNREHSQRDDDCMDDLHWEQDEGVCTQYDHTNNNRNPPRLLKVESYESGDTLRANSLRLSVVSKSHSFNGYEPQQQTRVLTKQDSGSSMSSRISPSSSGYKSQRSDATLSATPSPTATPNLHTQLSGQSGGALSPEPETVIWAVTDLASVPPGSMLIHPQTGQPYTNADGTIYHYDPSNPPRVVHCDGQTLNSMSGHMPQQKHHSEVMDGSCVITSQQAGGHEVGKTAIDSGYDSGGSNSYLAPPPLYQGSGPPSALTGSYVPQAHMMSSSGESQSYNHVVYPMPANQTPQVAPYHHQYDPRVQDGNDLSGYMMGLSIDSSRPPDSRQVMYWQTHHVQSHGAMPVYYNAGNPAPHSNPPSTHRYHTSGPPVPASACPPQTAFVPAPPPPPPQPAPAALSASSAPQHPQHITPEHANCAYGTAYSSGPECISYAPSVHMYYTQPYNGNGSGAGTALQSNSVPNGANPSYFNNSVPNCSAPIMALQYQQPCAHPTPPHTPQSMCSQFAFYNGCYPAAHYAQPNANLPVPQLFRKPLGPRCVSPMRPQYPMSPTVKERQSDDKMQPMPVYGFRVLPGDMRLIGNSGRLPFAVPTSKPSHPRRHRSKVPHPNRAGGQPSFDVSSLHTANKV